MDTETYLIFHWCLSTWQGTVTNTLEWNAFGALCSSTGFRQDFRKYLGKEGAEEQLSYAGPLQVEVMMCWTEPKVRDQTHSTPCTHSKPVAVWHLAGRGCWFEVILWGVGVWGQKDAAGRLGEAGSLVLPTRPWCWSVKHGRCRQMAELKNTTWCHNC